jgi:hypothetical protein
LLCALALPVLFLSAGAFADFQISSFELDPSGISLAPGSTGPVIGTVSIRNLGSSAANARLEVIAKDEQGTAKLTKTIAINGLAPGATRTLNAADRLSFDISGDWGAGNYTFFASVYDSDNNPNGQKIRVLTLQINKPAPIPEFEAFMLPLVAFSALALLFLSGKRK